MSIVDDLRRQIKRLSPEEFDEIVTWIVSQIDPLRRLGKRSYPWMSGIESSPDVCGGEPRIIRTRIPVWVLEQMRRMGMSEAEILRSYPTLRAEDLAHAWAYVDLHRDEIDEQIRANEEA